jgi:hypothetical protein
LRRCGALPSFERFSRLNTMVSILKKRQQGQNTRDITTRIISSILLRYLCVK